MSHEPSLRVSDVLAAVGQEFPALTPSKLRFLDSNGLVSPSRSSGGYRQYSPADIERLRFVLRQQRDYYRPLTVISGYLDDLDSGRRYEAVTPHEVVQQDSFLTPESLAGAADCDVELVHLLTETGLIAQASPGLYDVTTVEFVVAARAFVSAGGDVRSLKSLVRAAEREAIAAHDYATPARQRRDDARADHDEKARTDAAIAVFSVTMNQHLAR
ncbi:transcriptional regulator FtsR [Demequina sediminicola]|uniref:transcriptional regulator FtsR n=1 Tax=Demequina sediminicola TaxID=1095026 RepID=UPI001F3FB511|nr:MerR family transcriptional regulator [Demequina sediminicola]